MATIFTFTTDSAPPDEPIVVQSNCRKVVIREKDALGTNTYLIREASANNPQALIRAGESYTFHAGSSGLFAAGTTVGFISASSGSMNMQQIETAEDRPVY